jgi:16S rRNA (cytidine1402-2'-O)-methyltransferase
MARQYQEGVDAVSTRGGVLYVVATPIGNLQDLSPRALEVLRGVDLVLAEDTRAGLRLFRHFQVATRLQPYHDHNEERMVPKMLERLAAGEALALITEAGTPLISDPGFRLVRAAHGAGVKLVSVPGPCALITALAVSGIATDRFCFEGFLPARRAARLQRLAALRQEPRTMVFYEAPHRAVPCLSDMVEVFGTARRGTVARELTKLHEETYSAPLPDLLSWLHRKEPLKGELVIVTAGATAAEGEGSDAERLLRVLLRHLPASQAVAAASEISGRPRNALYRIALRDAARAMSPEVPEV